MKRSVVGVIERLIRSPAVRGLARLSDADLVDRYVNGKDSTAFAELVQRYGCVVKGVCSRMLTDAHDIDDAFQATFLVFVQKAATLKRRESVGNWLYGVAIRVAQQIRTRQKRRRSCNSSVEGLMSRSCSDENVATTELSEIIDEEIGRLPEDYREAVILCYFRGLSYTEAAKQLACPAGTVSGRLARARELLRSRLARRGLSVAPAALSLLLEQAHAQVWVSHALISQTVRIAQLFSSGEPIAHLVCSQVLQVSQEVAQSMKLTSLKFWSFLVFCTAVTLPVTHSMPPSRASVRGQPAVALGQDELEQCWRDLGADNPAVVARSLLKLAATPKQATALIKRHLPVIRVDAAMIEKLIRELDHDEFAVRDSASKKLEALGEVAKIPMERALKQKTSVEMQRRLERLLAKLNKQVAPRVPWNFTPNKGIRSGKIEREADGALTVNVFQGGRGIVRVRGKHFEINGVKHDVEDGMGIEVYQGGQAFVVLDAWQPPAKKKAPSPLKIEVYQEAQAIVVVNGRGIDLLSKDGDPQMTTDRGLKIKARGIAYFFDRGKKIAAPPSEDDKVPDNCNVYIETYQGGEAYILPNRFADQLGFLTPQERRLICAVVLLEHFSNPEARDYLEELAKGDAELLQTKQAKAALAREKKEVAVDELCNDLWHGDLQSAARAVLALARSPDKTIPQLEKTLSREDNLTPLFVPRNRRLLLGADGLAPIGVRFKDGHPVVVIHGKCFDLDGNELLQAAYARPEGVLRCIALLESIATPQASQLLRMLAQDKSNSLVAQEAKAALLRLGK